MNSNDSANTAGSQEPVEAGYGSPIPEDEMPQGAAANPGSPNPTLRGQENDEQALGEELAWGGADASDEPLDDEAGLELPSADAPLTDDNSGPTRAERESFSSESDADAAGDE